MGEGRVGERGRRSQITEEIIGHSVKYRFSLKCNRSPGVLEKMYILTLKGSFGFLCSTATLLKPSLITSR